MAESEQTPFVRAVRGALMALIPPLLILGAVRILLISAPIWVPLEYRMPGFPPDRYGFSTQDRIRWSAVDIRFLLEDHPISYFDDYILPEGEPMHNARELRHMEDVKRVVEGAEFALYALLGLLAAGFALLARSEGLAQALDALRAGARATWVLMAALALGLAVAFGALFVGFHQLFFDPGTWLFRYSDTFIRLYPERFWRDTFVLTALITALLAGGLYWMAGAAARRWSSSP
jgi:integral membrane protein (TIGR01906 family)